MATPTTLPARLVPALVAAAAVILGVAFILTLVQRPAPTTVMIVETGTAAVTDDRWHEIEETATQEGADLVEIVAPAQAENAPDPQWLQAVVGVPAVVVRSADQPGHSANLRIIDERGGEVQRGVAASAGSNTLLIALTGLGFLVAAAAATLLWRGPSSGAGRAGIRGPLTERPAQRATTPVPPATRVADPDVDAPPGRTTEVRTVAPSSHPEVPPPSER